MACNKRRPGETRSAHQRIIRNAQQDAREVDRSIDTASATQIVESGIETRKTARVYGADVEAALAKVWELMGYPCAEHMTRKAIDEHVAGCIGVRARHFSDTVTSQRMMMSEGTKKNRITGMRRRRNMTRGRSATVSAPLKGMIPIRKSHTWATLPTGYLQTDTVVHCGDLLTDEVGVQYRMC